MAEIESTKDNSQITKFVDFNNPNQQLDEQIAADKLSVRAQAVADATFIGQGLNAWGNFVARQFDEQPENYVAQIPTGYEQDSGAFIYAKSDAETQRIKQQIDDSRALRRYQETSPVESTALNFVPAAAEFVAMGGYAPSVFKAGVAVDAAIKTIPSALVRVPAYAAAGGLANGAVQVAFENLASLNDPLSTDEERLANIKFATGLGALLPFIGHGSVAGYRSMVRKFGQEAVDAEVRLVTDIAQKEAMPYQPIKQQAAFMPDDFSPDFPLAKTEEINLRFKESSVDAVIPNISSVYDGLARSIDEGNVSARLDISDDIARASEVVTGKKDVTAQPDEVRGTARLFFEDDAMTKRAADDVVEQRLAAYVEKAKSVVDDVGLSAGDAVTASRILNEVLRDIGSDIRVTEKRLSFEDELLDAVQTLTRRDFTRARAAAAADALEKKQTLGGGGTGVGAGSAKDFDAGLVKEEKVKLLMKANFAAKSGIASALTTPSVGLSLFGTPLAKRFGALLIDSPFRYNDPISLRMGHVPANSDRLQKINSNNRKLEDIRRETTTEFTKEAEKAGIKENLGKVFDKELTLALIKNVPDSKYASVNRFVINYRKEVLEPLLLAASKVGILKDKAVLGAEKYLTRYWDRDKIRQDFEGAVDYFYNGFKKQINNPNNPHRDQIDAMMEEYADRATMAAAKNDLSQEQIDILYKEDFDNWLKEKARETVNNIMGLGSKNNEGKYLNESVFTQMGRDRTVFLMDEDLYNDGFLIVDPVGAIARNARRLVSEIEIYKRFQTMDFEEAWMPVKAEIDAMRTRKGVADKAAKEEAEKAAKDPNYKKKEQGAELAKDVSRKEPEPPTVEEEMALKAHAREAWDINLESYTFMQNPANSSNSYTNQINQYTAAALKTASPFVDAITLSAAPIRNSFDLLWNSGRGNMALHLQGLLGESAPLNALARKVEIDELREMGLGLDIYTRSLNYQDLDIATKKGAPMARAQQVSQQLGQAYKTFGDFTYWMNDFTDKIATRMVMTRISKLADDAVNGRAVSAEDIGYLRDMMISEDDLRAFGEQIQKHGIDNGRGGKVTNHKAWDNQELADKYRSRVFYARHRNIQGASWDTPPIIAKTASGVLFGRFINASISQYQRGIVPYIQQGNAHFAGAVMAVGSIAVFNGIINDAMDGKETTIENSAKRFIFNGASSFASDAVNKFLWSLGDPEYGQAAGDFSVGRGLSGVYVDTADKIGNAVKGGVSMVMGDRPTSMEIKSMTDLMPARKVLPYRVFFNYLEDGVRTEYNYADKWGDPLEARTEEEQAQFRKQAKVKAAKETKAKKKREKSE